MGQTKVYDENDARELIVSSIEYLDKNPNEPDYLSYCGELQKSIRIHKELFPDNKSFQEELNKLELCVTAMELKHTKLNTPVENGGKE